MSIQYVPLGQAGLKVSTLTLGCYNFGWRTPAEDSARIIDKALEQGINLLDTADYYSDGQSEEIVGRAVKGRRSKVVVATKIHFPVGEGPNDRGNSRQHIMNQVEISLRRLQTDYIDLLQMHRPDPQTPLEETLRALDDLVRLGKVRYFGLSEFPAWQITEALWISDRLRLNRVVSNQPWYCMIRRELEQEVIPAAQHFGVGILAFGTLAFGLLSGKYREGEPLPEGSRGAAKNWPADSPHFRRDWGRAVKLVALAEEFGLVPTQFAIAWAMAQPGVTSAIIGPRTLEQLADNLAAADLQLEPELLRRVDEISPPRGM